MITGTIVGRLGADPETRAIASGQTVTNVRVAVDHGYGDKKTTTWVRIALWGKRGEKFAEYHHKGDGCEVSGTLYTREWEGKVYLECEGNDWSFLPRSTSGAGQGQASRPAQQQVPDEDAPW